MIRMETSSKQEREFVVQQRFRAEPLESSGGRPVPDPEKAGPAKS